MATASGFRQTYPEFGDTSAYPDAQLNIWLAFSQQLVNQDRWGDLYDLGVYLLMAHNLVIWKRNSKAAVSGTPGAAGVMSAKSVDAASVSYDTSVASSTGAGSYNLTTYGAQFADLSNLFGAGGMQL